MIQPSLSSRHLFGLTLCGLILSTGLMAQTQLKPGFNLFTPAQDVEIGQQSAAEIEKALPVLQSKALQDYISAVGSRLAKATEGPEFPYQFKVVDVADVNAFALPGGFMYVHRGLIEAADNEAELAGVMAHEISHVSLRHGTNQASKAYLAQAGLGILGGLLGGGKSSTAQIIGAVGGFGLNATFLKFGRDAEKQADLMGVQILARAGYDPAGMASFFEQLREIQGRDPSRMETFFSSHPAPADRSSYVTQEIQMLQVRPTGPTGNFASIKAQLSRMPKAKTMKELVEGAAPNSGGGSPDPGSKPAPPAVRIELPSSRVATYSSAGGLFQVKHPENWKAYPARQGDGVTILPEGGVVKVGEEENIVVGAIFNTFDPTEMERAGNTGLSGPFRSRNTLDRRANLLVQDVQRNNAYLKAVNGSTQALTVDGDRAVSVDLSGTSPSTGITEYVRLVARALPDGHVLYFLFVSPEEDSEQLKLTFQRMLSSLTVRR